MSNEKKSRWNTRTGIILYVVITVLALVYVGIILYFSGIDGLKRVLRETPGLRVDWTVIYVSLTWLLLGSILLLLHGKIINRETLVFFGAFYLFCFLYLNFLGEKTSYGGDVFDYINAAFNLQQGEPLNQRYLYPPFWASCLQPLTGLGKDAVWKFCLVGSYFSLVLLFPLLYLALKQYGFKKYWAVGAVFIILCVNVPVIRTVFRFQVNIHVVNLILLSLLFFPRRCFWSATALALAVHIKVSPLILVLAFLVGRQWKWLIYFLAANLAIVAFTSLMNSPQYYLDFCSNIMSKSGAEGFAFRNNSIDSFIRATFTFLHIGIAKAGYLTALLKLAVLVGSLVLFFKSIGKKVFHRGESSREVVYNGYVVLIFPMLILSPLVWEHHWVFLILPFLVLLKTIRDDGGLVLYVLAYFLIFLIPTFDFYPFSYHRLLGLGLCYILLARSLQMKDNGGEWWDNAAWMSECVDERLSE